MKLHRFTAMGYRFDRYEFSCGEGLPSHSHNEDHLTVVASGRIVARTSDRELERGPLDQPILFKAGRIHEVEALEDNTVIINIFS